MEENNEKSVELSKYFSSQSIEMKRSDIHFADYNPRIIDEDGKRALKRSIKKYGVVGGIVVNQQSGNTIVGGHQKVAILDELNKYEEGNDYMLRVELIDVDITTEKSLNVALNNPNVGGKWDYEKMRQLIPDINYKDAGLTDADLSMIGVDYLLKTEAENDMASALDDMMAELNADRQAEVQARKEEREAAKEAAKAEEAEQRAIEQQIAEQMAAENPTPEEPKEPTKAEKTQHMKEVKKDVQEQATKKAENMDAFVVLSFDTLEAKMMFCRRFGYDPYIRFIKGEEFDAKVEMDFGDDEEYDDEE